MKVIDKLKLNNFKLVSIPRNKDLFDRIGGRVSPMGTTGFTAEISRTKLDVLADSEQALTAQMLKDNQMPIDTSIP